MFALLIFFQWFSMNLRMKNVQHIWSTDYRVQTNNYERAFLKHLLSDMIFLFAFLFCIWGWRIRCVPHDSLLLCHRWKYSFFGMMCCRKFRGAIRVFFFFFYFSIMFLTVGFQQAVQAVLENWSFRNEGTGIYWILKCAIESWKKLEIKIKWTTSSTAS